MKKIPLNGTHGQGRYALIDDEDYALVAPYKWCLYANGYVMAHIRPEPGVRRTLYMHRIIMDAGRGEKVDHVDGDPLNNRRSNLRFATSAQNAANSYKVKSASGYKGVFRGKGKTVPWDAKIRIDGKVRHLGCFATREEAARVYDDAARRLHGQFARLNFPDD